MKQQQPITIRAVTHLFFHRLRAPGDLVQVPNEAWADFFIRRGMAERADGVAAEEAPTTKAKRPKRSLTDRTPATTNAAMSGALTG